MAVAAMGAGDVVLVGKMHADPDRGGLLAGVEMDEARDVAGLELLAHPVLEGADGAHVAIGADQFLAAELHVVPPRIGQARMGLYQVMPPSRLIAWPVRLGAVAR